MNDLELPNKHIRAHELKRRVGNDAIGIALSDPSGIVTAWVAHCETGPYLMSVREWEIYKSLFQAN